MFCKNCGQENAEDLNFCQKCGSSLAQEKAEQPAQPVVEEQVETAQTTESTEVAQTIEATQTVNAEVVDTANTDSAKETAEPKPKTDIVGLLIKIGIPVVALVLILVIAITALTPPKFNLGENIYLPIYNSDDENTTIIYNDKEHSKKIDGNIGSVNSNMDFTVFTATNDDDVLFVVDSKNVTQAAEEVDRVIMSTDGKGIAYLDYDGSLFHYDVSKKKSSKIAEDVSSSFVISPNGKTVLYNLSDGEDTELCMYVNGKITKLGKDLSPVAVADSGKYIYAKNSEAQLYTVDKKGDKNKLSNDVYHTSFNRDNTQVLFETDDGGTYVSVKGKEKIKIASKPASLLLPDTAVQSTNQYDVASFLNQTYTTDSSAILVDSKGESKTVVRNAYDFTLSNDGKVLYYTKGLGLYRCALKEDALGKKMASNFIDGSKYKITADGKGVYYIDEDDALKFTKNGDKSVKIQDDVEQIVVTDSGLALFINDDGVLYSCKNGGKSTKIADEVDAVINYGNYAYYTTENEDGEGSLFISKGNGKFKEVLSKFPSLQNVWIAENLAS